MSPELQILYRRKVAYGEDPSDVLRYVKKLEKTRSKTKSN